MQLVDENIVVLITVFCILERVYWIGTNSNYICVGNPRRWSPGSH